MRGRLFYSSLMMETNSFAALPTTLEDFHREQYLVGSDILYEDGQPRPALKLLFEFAEKWNCDLVAGLSTSAPPGRPVSSKDFEILRDTILKALKEAMPVKAVFLNLHGAMIADNYYDCEGDLLSRIRDIVGPNIPIGAVLDPHAHLTEQMVGSSNILAFMKEYPHIDGAERSQDVLKIIDGILSETLSPVPAIADCHLISFFPTQDQPMRGFVDDMIAEEKDPEILSISFIHGFPWGDTPFTGAKVLVYSDGNLKKAQKTARNFRKKIWAIKDNTLPDLISVDEAISRIETVTQTPIILADQADNPGGGAPSDSTFILQALLEGGISNVAIGLIFDPAAVGQCHAADVGDKIELEIGGKYGEISGRPVKVKGTVKALCKNARMKVVEGVDFPMGDTAWVEANGIDIVLSSHRLQMYAPDGFEHLGIEIKQRSALVVKSSNHFRAFFDPIAAESLYVGTPGAIDMDFTRLPYENFKRPYYPKNNLSLGELS